MADARGRQVTITLVRSLNGRLRDHKACAAGLGLRRLRQTVTVADTRQNRGMMRKISYLLDIKEATNETERD